MNPVLHFFVYDWRRKLLAVLLAFGLWWYVDGLIETEGSGVLRVTVADARVTPEDGTLTVRVPAGWTLVEPRPGSSVRVRLRGSRSNLHDFTTRQFAAFHELRAPAAGEGGADPVESVRPDRLEWRRPAEAGHLLARPDDPAAALQFRIERLTSETFELRHELLRVRSELDERQYDVMLLDAGFELTQADLSGPQRLVEEAMREVTRAAQEPGSGSRLFAEIRLPQTTRREAVVLLRLDPSWTARGLRMDPEWVRVTIPIQLKVKDVHVWAPALQVEQETPARWAVPPYAAQWRVEMLYPALQAGVPFKEWMEQHVYLFLPLSTLRAEGQDLAEARVEWTLVDVDQSTRAALLDALVVRPVDEQDATVLLTRIP
jgi:hypothetical protein